MLSSLRFRLPALFFFGIVVSGVIAAAIALRLFQGYVQSRLKAELRRDAVGLTELYQEQANKFNGAAPKFAAWPWTSWWRLVPCWRHRWSCPRRWARSRG